ncbi:hypothetical protein Egran_06643 [Elaphomyces granulatus]|uniref:60S ribosomal protein L41 n=1 Tax=Elaphomyces granulatus TaxID=519963 RepID=A0A232LN71_9EURO|nr:hypothetical protein Egran_06643 [Elaphomyces granulatus]
MDDIFEASSKMRAKWRKKRVRRLKRKRLNSLCAPSQLRHVEPHTEHQTRQLILAWCHDDLNYNCCSLNASFDGTACMIIGLTTISRGNQGSSQGLACGRTFLIAPGLTGLIGMLLAYPIRSLVGVVWIFQWGFEDGWKLGCSD